MRGKFIVFEGLDCAGKSTLAKVLAEWLPGRGLLPEGSRVILTHEPGGTEFGSRVRPALLEPREGAELCQRAALLLFAADRAQHVEEVIKPALERGDWVVCDRFTGSTIAYQAHGHGLPLDNVKEICKFSSMGIKPDLTILLDITVEESIRRMQSNPDSYVDRQMKEDLDFLWRVRTSFLMQRASNSNWILLDACTTLPVLKSSLLDAVKTYFK